MFKRICFFILLFTFPAVAQTNIPGLPSPTNPLSSSFLSLVEEPDVSSPTGFKAKKATLGQVATYVLNGATAAIPATPNPGVVVPSGVAGTANVLSATSAFDSWYCNTIGYAIVRTTGAWTCSKSITANPVWWGADPTGTTDSAAAFNSALAASSSVAFPAGKFKFLSQISYAVASGASLNISGAGADNTILTWPTGNGISLSLSSPKQSFHIRDVSITSGASPGGSGLIVTSSSTSVTSNSDVSNVSFRGDDWGGNVGAGTQYWTYGINITTQDQISFFNDIFIGGPALSGTGIAIVGNNPVYAFADLVANSTFINLNYGINLGDFTQGLLVTNSSFSGQHGIEYIIANGINCCLSVVGSEFNDTVSGIRTASTAPFYTYQITNNLFFIPANAVGISITHDGGGNITGNNFQPGAGGGATGQTAIAIASSSSNFGASIVGNTIYFLANGVVLTTGSANAVVQGNIITSTTNPMTFISSTNNRVEGNIGYNPVGISNGAYAPASTVTYTAGFSPETHYLTGGTVTAVKIPANVGQTVCTTTPCTVSLGPNEGMSITYTVAPNDLKSVH